MGRSESHTVKAETGLRVALSVTVRGLISIVTFTLLMLLWLHEHIFQFLFKRLFVIGGGLAEFFIGDFTGDVVENFHSLDGLVINVDISDLWWPDGVLLCWLDNFLLEHLHLFLVFLNTNMNVVN